MSSISFNELKLIEVKSRELNHLEIATGIILAKCGTNVLLLGRSRTLCQ